MPVDEINSLRELRQIVREDWSRNDQSWFRPGCQALAVYRFGVWRRSVSSRIPRAILDLTYRVLNVLVRNTYGIELYHTTRIGRRLRIAHQSGIIIHPDAVLGDDCMIRQGVSIGRASNRGGGIRSLAPIIGDGVDIGAGAAVLGGITVGDFAVIGPNAVVVTNVPAGAIVSAPPSKIIARPPRRKSDQVIAEPGA
jgi:serine O-acetyltransferase